MAKQITNCLREGHGPEAREIARYGRRLCGTEYAVLFFYLVHDELEAAMKGKKLQSDPLFGGDYDHLFSEKEMAHLCKLYENRKRTLTELFINAVIRHDTAKLEAITRAVEFFKDKRPSRFSPEDGERMALLYVKSLSDGAKYFSKSLGFTAFNIREIVQLVLDNGGKHLYTPEDGFSALRRKCKQMGIPIAPSRKISGK